MRKADPQPRLPITIDRPGDRWQCGFCESESPCARGPSADGTCCQATPENPCRPVRRWSAFRRLLATSIIAAGCGILLIAFGSPWRQDFLAPGSLTQSHAQILGGTLASQRCAACHVSAGQDWSAWFSSAGEHHRGTTQDSLCMACHHTTIQPSRGTLAHNLSDAELDSLRAFRDGLENNRWNSTDRALVQSVVHSENTIACAACHREHRGSQHDLTALSDANCQSCHRRSFERFSTTHPDWKQWPYMGRGTIAFNHQSHHGYFASKNLALDCTLCHQQTASKSNPVTSAASSKIIRVPSYESACASCHDPTLQAASAGGIAVLELPTLDIDALGDDSDEIPGDGSHGARWPAELTAADAFHISPLTAWLLSSDPQAMAAIATLSHSTYRPWEGSPTPAQAQAIGELAAATESLLQKLGTPLETLFVTSLDRQFAADIFHGLPPQWIHETAEAWLARFAVKESTDEERFESAASASPGASPGPLQGWYRDDLSLRLEYRGYGHADRVLIALCELASSSALEPQQREELRKLPIVSSCLQCHRKIVPGDRSGWRGHPPKPEQPSFTRFSHEPHLKIGQLADCTYCHRIEMQTNSAAALEPSDFLPLERVSCAHCHQPGGAGDQCTQCHRYHVEPIKKSL